MIHHPKANNHVGLLFNGLPATDRSVLR